jgi:hypothetical protein
MPCPSHPPWLYHSNYTWRKVQVMKLRNMNFSLVTSSLFGPNILLSNLFSNTHSPCSSLNIRDQVSHSYRTTGKVIVLNILIFYVFRQQTRRQKVLDWMVTCITRIQSPLNFLTNQIFSCYYLSQIFELCHIFKGSVSYFYITILPYVEKTEKSNVKYLEV